MSNDLYDAVARVARHEAGQRSWLTMGQVVEVHTNVALGADHAVSVELRDSRVIVPRVPLAVGALGFAAIPSVGDLVVVAFADGDPHNPIVIGRLYHRDLSPPEHGDGQVVMQLPPGNGAPEIDLLADPATPEVRMTVGSTTVEITGQRATVSIGEVSLDIDGGGAGAIAIAAGDAKISLDGAGALALEAATSIELKAPEVTIEGTAKVTVSGGIVEVN